MKGLKMNYPLTTNILKYGQNVFQQLETAEHFVIINAPKDFTTTLLNIIHYEDLLAEQTDDFEWHL